MLYDDLNPAQRQAVVHPGGPLLILAGAGSGKTRVITHRLAELVRRGVPPYRILAVTFTNKAAGEMRERAERLLKGAAHGMWIGTFHSVCARLLRIHAAEAGLPRSFVIFDDSDQMSLCNQICKELQLSDEVAPRAILSAIDQAKNRAVDADEYRGHDYFTDLVARVYPIYQLRLREFGAVDFGDLLLLPLRLSLKDEALGKALAGRFDHVLVDEFQDVNQVQYRLVCHLSGRTRELMVVGDDDQAIYGWRGADVGNLLDFERDWPDAQVVKLEQNYRSTRVILEAANAVIARNRRRRGKHLFTETEGGEPLLYHAALDERREAAFVVRKIQHFEREERRALGDFAIFYRTNAQSRVIEEALRGAGLPYTVLGGMRFYDRAEIKDVLAYLRLCQNPADEVALRRVINVPSRGIGESTVGKIEERARAGGVSLWQALRDLLLSEGTLSAGPRKKLLGFVRLIEDLQKVQQAEGLSALADAVVERTGYLERLSLDAGPESLGKRENVMELLGSIRERARESEAGGDPLGLVDYLEQISLASSVDATSRGVSLMTVHAAKGLEFPVVFVTGLEDGLFPSLRRREEHSEAEDPIIEERRLAYVALTRARQRLVLTYAQSRRLYGQAPRPTEPSRFLREIPSSCLAWEVSEEREGTWQQSSRSGRTAWSSGRYLEQDEDGAPPQDDYARHGPPAPPAPPVSEDGYHIEPDEDAGYAGVVRRGQPGRRGQHRQPPGGDELRVEYDDASDARGHFRLGQQVRHVQFGEGEVRAFSGAGSSLKLVVYFPEVGAKTVLANFLEPL